jgi:hypothetical protein
MPTVVAPATASESGKKSRQHDQHDRSSDQGSAGSRSAFASKTTQQLSSEESAEVQRLSQRDREVRAHEAAHKGVAGRYARGGAEFEYERGPDGRQYAVGGEVSIDVSRPNDASAALQKALLIQRAALAPAQPSAQDRAVAAEAAQMAVQARKDLQTEKAEDGQVKDVTPGSTTANPVEQAYTASTLTNKPQIDYSV